ncbi:MAG: hypothetical protein OXH09_18905 [Gammaproteobacteria bacterium]|nr:hypothetical protein [Gammaproteobacteria bacterium]
MRHWILSAAALLLSWPAIGQTENDRRGREHSLPLVMADGDPERRQGFVRIINHSDEPGTVEIVANDDAGMRYGPIELSIGARETKHLNSADIESGNEGKGLPEGLGDGEGDWRLLLYGGDLDIEPLAYIRTLHDGFLTSMHDVVPDASLRHRVPVFNPGSNVNQASSLRLINPGDAEAMVTITGRDDAKVEEGEDDEPSAPFSLTIPAGGAQTVASADLEMDGIGDGTGKWSLDVVSDVPITVVNLMSTVSGHLTNLSSTNPNYRGATGLWQISFEDEEGGEGYIVLLPDSRMYAWLPEADEVDRVARATFWTTGAGVAGSGELYESGKAEQVGLDVKGGSEDFEFTAEYRAGDWIRGQYNVVGETPRSFHGWAFTGFERGGATEEIAGLWSPEEDDADLDGDFEPDADGSVSFSFQAGGFTCNVSGAFEAINPAFAVYEADVTITCSLLVLPPSIVDLILVVMDKADDPAGGTRSVVLAVVHDDRELGFGTLFMLERE